MADDSARSMMIETSVSGVNQAQAQEECEDDWEDAETVVIAVDYSRVGEVMNKVKKASFSHKNQELSNLSLHFNQSFMKQHFNHHSPSTESLPSADYSADNQQLLAVKGEADKKFQWTETSTIPVCGTSILLSVDLDSTEIEVIGKSQSQIVLDRKHFGAQSKIAKVNLVEELYIKDDSLIKQESVLKKRSRLQKELETTLDKQVDDRRRERKKKWKTHSKISVHKLEPNSSVVLGDNQLTPVLQSFNNGVQYESESGKGNLQSLDQRKASKITDQ